MLGLCGGCVCLCVFSGGLFCETETVVKLRPTQSRRRTAPNNDLNATADDTSAVWRQRGAGAKVHLFLGDAGAERTEGEKGRTKRKRKSGRSEGRGVRGRSEGTHAAQFSQMLTWRLFLRCNLRGKKMTVLMFFTDKSGCRLMLVFSPLFTTHCCKKPQLCASRPRTGLIN